MNTEQAPGWLPPILIPFFTLSHPVPRPTNPDSFPNSNYYLPGLLDGCLIITCIAIMAVLRDAFRIFVLEPFAHWYLTRKRRRDELKDPMSGPLNAQVNGVANGAGGNGHALEEPMRDMKRRSVSPAPVPPTDKDELRKRRREERVIHRSVIRFAEQGWSVIYYSVNWAFGLYIHCNLPTAPFRPSEAWLGYPHLPLAGPLKLYYLIQTAFYMHQMLILNAEARRKDHVQMMTHHVISVALMVISYFYNFTRIGCLIMVLMDYCDIFLPLAKMFRYLSLPKLCDATFVWFLFSWLVSRHVLFIMVIKSTYIDLPIFVPFAWEPESGYYFTQDMHVVFCVMLSSLQFIQIIWFGMICRVAWRVVSGQGAEDTRSDDEDADDSLSEDTPKNAIPPNSGLKKRR